MAKREGLPHMPTKEEADKIEETITPAQEKLTENREKMKTGLSNKGIEGHLSRKEESWEGRKLHGIKNTWTGNLNGHEIVFWDVRLDSHLDTLDPNRVSKETWDRQVEDEGLLCGGSVDGHEMSKEQAIKFMEFAYKSDFGTGKVEVDAYTENRLIEQAQRELGTSKSENSTQALDDFFATFETQ